MGLLSALSTVFLKRSDDGDLDDRWYSPLIAYNSAGVFVTPDNITGVAAVYACVAAISQTISTLPLLTYDRLPDGSRERAVTSPYYYMFAAQPNNFMNSSEWVEMMLVHLLLRGNAYNQILRQSGTRRVVGILPLSVERMELQLLDDLTINYKYTYLDGRTRDFSQSEILHFRIGCVDGLVGRSPIRVARESLATTLAMEETVGRFIKNSVKPGGVLTHPAKLSKESSERIRNSWQQAHSGSNQGKVAVLEEGLKFEAISMSGEDSQFVEQRKFQLEEVARIFRVPPQIIGHFAGGGNVSVEEQGMNFVVYCLMYYSVRIEQTLKMKFYSEPINNREMFTEFLFDGLLRGNKKDRQTSYEIMRRNGVMSANQWAKLENLPPIDDGTGDRVLVPQNFIWSDDLTKAQASKGPSTPDPAAPPGDNTAVQNAPRSLPLAIVRGTASKLFAEILERMIFKEEGHLQTLAKRCAKESEIAEFMQRQEGIVRSALDTPIDLYRAASSPEPHTTRVGDAIWNKFWKDYSSSVGQRGAFRAITLSDTLCRLIDSELERGSNER